MTLICSENSSEETIRSAEALYFGCLENRISKIGSERGLF